jgi:hypothetical protein
MMKRTQTMRAFRKMSGEDRNKLKKLYYKNKEFRNILQMINPDLAALSSASADAVGPPFLFNGNFYLIFRNCWTT